MITGIFSMVAEEQTEEQMNDEKGKAVERARERARERERRGVIDEAWYNMDNFKGTSF